MKSLKNYDPTAIITPYKGKLYSGEWPTLPELFKISLDRVPNNACFTDFEGPGGARNALTYTQVVQKIQGLADWLAVNGVKRGDRIAVTGKNSPEWAAVYL